MGDPSLWGALLGALIGSLTTFGAAAWTYRKTLEKERAQDEKRTFQETLLAFLDWYGSHEPIWKEQPEASRRRNLDPGAIGLRVVLFTDGLASQAVAVARTVLAGAAQYERRGEQDLARDATQEAIDALRIAFYEAQDELDRSSPKGNFELEPNQFGSPWREELLKVNERWGAIIEQGRARRKED